VNGSIEIYVDGLRVARRSYLKKTWPDIEMPNALKGMRGNGNVGEVFLFPMD